MTEKILVILFAGVAFILLTEMCMRVTAQTRLYRMPYKTCANCGETIIGEHLDLYTRNPISTHWDTRIVWVSKKCRLCQPTGAMYARDLTESERFWLKRGFPPY